MNQKETNGAWRLIALVFVFSIGISLLAMPSMQTLAVGSKVSNGDLPAHLYIWKTPGAGVMSVMVKAQIVGNSYNKSNSSSKGASSSKGTSSSQGSSCVELGPSESLVPVNMSLKKSTKLVISTYLAPNCVGSKGSYTDYIGQADYMPPCSTDRGCRVYTIYTMAKPASH